jgi:hypothetical protein
MVKFLLRRSFARPGEMFHHLPGQPPAAAAMISESMADLTIAGVIVEVDPDEADRAGAFLDDALNEEAAWDANVDL